MDCVICLSDMQESLKLSCGHRFHQECISKSCLTSPHPKCPLCRAPVEEIQVGLDAVRRYHQSGLLMGDIQLIHAGADLGSTLCIYTLGNIFYSGFGVDADHEKAVFYWKQTEHVYAASCHNLAYMARKRGDLVEAAACYRKAISLRPLAKYFIQLADLLGPTDDSVALYTAALEICDAEEEARIYMMLGKIAYIQRKHKEAHRHFDRSLKLNPANDYVRVMAALTSQRTSTAHAHLDVVLCKNRNHLEAICLKGHIYLTEKNKEAAEEMMRRACKISPSGNRTEELKTVMRSFGPLTRKRCREGN